MQRFTTGDVLKLTELPGTSFDRWVNKGQVQPISGGSGTGNHRVWTLMQTVGWVVAAEAWNSQRSCVPEYVCAVVNAFGAVTEEWLQKQLKERGKHLATIHQGKPLLQGIPHPALDWPNVEAAYKRVLKCGAAKR